MSIVRTYLVPDLAVVTVDGDVIELVRGAIDFQLGHFALAAEAPGPAGLPRIRVEPYARFAAPAGDVRFQSLRAEPGRLLHDPEGRHATCRTADGFEVFSDSPQVLVILLLQNLALRQGRTFLHAAAWCDAAGAVTLVPGPGGVGKTALLSAAVQRHGALLLGDDLVLVGAAGAAAFPRAFVLKEYHRGLFPGAFATATTERRSRDRWRPLVRFLRENAPFHGLFKSVFRRAGRLESASSWLHSHATPPEYLTVPVARLFGPGRIGTGGLVQRVIYIEWYEGTEFLFVLLAFEVAVQRSLAVLHHEWSDYLRWFCALGAVELVDLGAHFRSAEAAMRAAFAGAEVSLLQVPVGASPEALERAFAARAGFDAKRA
ncbi:MAG: hypothetical protein IPN11_00630 [Opitutaceae bacterium]|nr:hypothetical protein [Opitutaceae bacterium]